jgi:hypothetical protein
MRHLQVHYSFLVRQNIQLAMILLLLPKRSRLNIYKKFEVKLIPLYNSIKIDLVEVKCYYTQNIKIIGYYIMKCGVGAGN